MTHDPFLAASPRYIAATRPRLTQRNRHLPIQSTPDNRKWSPLLKMTVSFAIFFAVLIGGCSVLWGLG